MKIVSLVMNSGAKDARVIKEANSLTDAGHDVTVIGIKDNNSPGASALLENGLQVHRIDWRAEAYYETGKKYLFFTVIGLAAAAVAGLVLLWAARDLFTAFFSGVSWLWSRQITLAPLETGGSGVLEVTANLIFYGFKLAALAAFAGVFVYVFYRAVRAALRILKRGYIDKVARLLFTAQHLGQEQSMAPRSAKLVYDAISTGPRRAVADLSADMNDKALNAAFRRIRTREMERLALEFEPDAVHAHEAMTLPAGVALKKKTGAKLVYDAHELYEDLAQATDELKEINRRIHEECLPHVDRMITVNDSIARTYKTQYPFLPDPIVIKNATPHTALEPYDGRLHRAAGLPSDRKILLYQGGFAKKRGLEELVAAGKLLPEGWSLVMMGWGRHEDALKQIRNEAAREWIAGVIAERRRRAYSAIPEDAIDAIQHDIEAQAVKTIGASFRAKPAAVKKETKTEEDERRAAPDNESGNGDAPSPAKDEGEKTAAPSTGADPFAYRTDAAVRHQSAVLSSLVNLRLERMNAEEPVSENSYDKIRFVPPVARDELEQWTQGASIGIIPYENDGLNHWFCSPNKLWEYPNAGVPILASCMPELRNVIQGAGIGWLLPPDHKAGDIARVISKIADEDIAEKRENCARHIERDNWRVYEKRLVDCFNGLESGGGA